MKRDATHLSEAAAAATPVDTAATGRTIAELVDVFKVYGEGDAAVHALRDINLVLTAGELVVVLGPSGSGKTTLLNVLGGIEPATRGKIVLAGRDLSGLNSDQLADVRRETLGFVFQFFNLIPTLTARENVSVIAELIGSDVGNRVEEVLHAVGLAERANHFPGQLSGGQQQRVAIARALVTSPKLLLCDEPTGSLDLETGRQVLQVLQRIARAGGRTVVIVTHNQAIAKLADRVIRMGSGEIIEDVRQDQPLDADSISW